MRIFFTKDYNMIINKKTLNLEVSDIWKYTNFYLQNQNPKG